MVYEKKFDYIYWLLLTISIISWETKENELLDHKTIERLRWFKTSYENKKLITCCIAFCIRVRYNESECKFWPLHAKNQHKKLRQCKSSKNNIFLYCLLCTQEKKCKTDMIPVYGTFSFSSHSHENLIHGRNFIFMDNPKIIIVEKKN